MRRAETRTKSSTSLGSNNAGIRVLKSFQNGFRVAEECASIWIWKILCKYFFWSESNDLAFFMFSIRTETSNYASVSDASRIGNTAIRMCWGYQIPHGWALDTLQYTSIYGWRHWNLMLLQRRHVILHITKVTCYFTYYKGDMLFYILQKWHVILHITKVKVYGDGTTKVKTLKSEEMENPNRLKAVAADFPPLKPIKETFNELTRKLME